MRLMNYVTESHKGTETDVTERWVLKALVPSLELQTVIPERALGGHVAEIFFLFFLLIKKQTQRGETYRKSGAELGLDVVVILPHSACYFGISDSFPCSLLKGY